ncbi:MAG: hypothetical protein K9W44_01055 [Candidatus Lokiarchaeota archaeon]|nr:hypothetical protein [Candidatus Harpocratesius repetitus]
MEKNKIRKVISFTVIVMIFLVSSSSFYYRPHTNFSNNVDDGKNFDNSFRPDEISKIDDKLYDENSNLLHSPVSAAGAIDWWDENFDFRKLITITEPNVKNREYEPVTLYFSFDNGTAYKNSTRIVYYDGSSQTEIPSQTWNMTYWQDGGSPGDFLKSCSVTFSVTIAKNSTNNYYLYYSSSAMATNYDQYYIDTGMSTSYNPSTERAVVDTDSLYVEFGTGSAFDTFQFENTDPINYHTDTSMSPLSDIVSGGSSDTYSPDAYGFIRDWLLVGSFDTSPYTSWSNTPTVYHPTYGTGIYNMIDPTQLYVEGSYATAPPEGEACSRGLDETKQWFAHHDADDYINLQDADIFGTQDDEVAYGMIYVYFPQDVSPGYALIGSDDGVRLYMDGTRVHENHVLRAPRVDQDSVNLGTIAAGWHSFIIMVEERGGGWGFRLRFSSNSSAYEEIPNLVISHIPKINIESISLVEEGPIFSTFDLTWEDSATMKTWDTITFYRDFPMVKYYRTFWWKDNINETTGNEWTIFNTNYPSSSTTGVDVYIEDSSSSPRALSSDDFIAENYVITYDNTGNNEKVACGVFVTDLVKGNPIMEFSSANMTAFYTSDQPNIVCGYQTDLNNHGPRNGDYPTQSNYNVSVEFWEMAKKYLPITLPTINEEIDAYYQSLENPLQSSIDNEEKLFFNLGFELTDRDDLPARNVNITLYNTTENWSGYYTSITGPNTFEPISQKSDESGKTTFYNLKQMNLTCKISYQAYNKPEIELRWVNITLDTTQTVQVSKLNLTQIVLNLQNYDNPAEVISGANVSLYWNNTDPNMNSYGGYIGSEISDDSGQVTFYYLNSTEATGNYTIKVYSYGDYRLLNYSVVDVGTYHFQNRVNFTVSQYTTHTISVQMENFESRLSWTTNNPTNPYSNLVNSHYWNQNLTIIANYTYGTTSGGYFGISEAVVNYEIVDDSLGLVIHSGTMNSNGTAGYYELTFNSSDGNFNLDTNRRYVLYIYASKAGFEPLTEYVSIEVQEITTELVISYDNYAPYWFENFTALVYYNDTLNNRPVENANISFTNSELNGTFVELGNGWYRYEFNSTQFSGTGAKSITINAQKNHYESKSQTDEITIKIIPTTLVSLHASDTISAYWEDNITILVNFTDTYYQKQILTGDLSFSVVGIPSLTGSLIHQGNGIYSCELNTTQFIEAGIHYISITAVKEYYETSQIQITLNLSKVPTNLTTETQYISVYWEENFTLSVSYFDTYRDLPINSNSEVTSYLVGSTLFDNDLVNVGNGQYNLTYNTTSFDQAGNYSFIISAQRNQYESKSIIIYVQIKIIPTEIYSNHVDDHIQVYWSENIYLSINLNDTYRNQPIPDASVIVDTIRNTSMDLSMNYVGGFTYNLTINSSSLGDADSYIFHIVAAKNQYETSEIYIYVDVLLIPVSFSTQTSQYNLNLNEEFTISVLADDTRTIFGGPIPDGTVSYIATGPDSFLDTGFITSENNGSYSETFNTTSYFNRTTGGTYTYTLTFTKNQYETQTLTIIINVAIIPTTLTTPNTTITLFWEESFTIAVTYLDARDSSPLADATISYIITGPASYTGSGALTYIGSGEFSKDFISDIDFNRTGTYTFTITAELSEHQTQSLSITVNIETVLTNLTVSTETINVYWREEFTLSVYFEDIRDLLNSVPITTGATVSYTVTGPVGYSGSGSLIHYASSPGTYRDTLNSTDFGFNGTYTFVITAMKNQYETQSVTITVYINIIPTKLTAEDLSISVNWGESFELSVYYEDLYKLIAINDGTVGYSASGPNEFADSGLLSSLGTGWYYISFDAIEGGQFVAGTYTYLITAQKSQYLTQSLSITVNIAVINTTLTTASDTIAAAWNDNFTISIVYFDEDNSQNITDGSVTYTVIGHPEYNGTIAYSFIFNAYVIEFNTTYFGTNGTYSFTITASKNQYETQQLVINVDIGIRPVNFTTNASKVYIYWEMNCTLSVSYFDIYDSLNPVPISTGTVSYVVSGTGDYSDSGVFVYSGSNGRYELFLSSFDFGQAGSYTFEITASKPQYATRTLVITVAIMTIPTELSSTYENDSITLYWGESENLTVSFDNIVNTSAPIGIGDATVSYYAASLGISNGYLISQNDGTYTFDLQSIDFGQAGTYTFRITATKNQYETQQLVLTIHILVIPTSFTTSQTNYTVTWRDQFTITVQFTDLYRSTGITDGTVSFYVGQQAGLTGILSHESGGTYSITLNSTDFAGVGSYTLYVTAEKYQYSTQIITFYLVIDPIQTRINNTIFLRNDISINVSTTHYFYITYGEIDGTAITGANIAYFEWEDSSGTHSRLLTDMKNGYYRMDFDTISKPVGTYLIAVYLGKNNFVTRSATITLIIKERPVVVALGEQIASKVAETPEGNMIVIEFNLTDPVDNAPLTGATVTMHYRGNDIPIPETDTPGLYRYVIDTNSEEYNALVAAITDTATITVEKTNYTIAPFDITISVTPPEFTVGGVGVPKIFVYIGGSVALIAIAIAGTTKYIQYARIPLIIKQIDRTKKLISGNKVISDDNITKTYEEEISDRFKDYWELLDLDIASILGVGKSTTPEPMEELGSSTEGGL